MEISDLTRIEKHLFERPYMCGVQRGKTRVKERGELFTPKYIVDELLDRLEQSDPSLFKDPTKTFLDPTCGDGEFLAGALFRKLSNGIAYVQAVKGLFGVGIMLDNVLECRKRLLCGRNDEISIGIVENNIRNKDALSYNFRFDNKLTSEDYRVASSFI